jgi:WD40 repeat protein
MALIHRKARRLKRAKRDEDALLETLLCRNMCRSMRKAAGDPTCLLFVGEDRLAVGDNAGGIGVWSLSHSKQEISLASSFPNSHAGGLRSLVQHHRNGSETIVSAGREGSVRIWATGRGEPTPVRTLNTHEGGLVDCAASSLHSCIATVGLDRRLVLSSPDEQLASMKTLLSKEPITSVAFSEQSSTQLLVSCGSVAKTLDLRLFGSRHDGFLDSAAIHTFTTPKTFSDPHCMPTAYSKSHGGFRRVFCGAHV